LPSETKNKRKQTRLLKRRQKVSTLIVEICKIEKIDAHPNADRLELAHVKGWICIVQKGAFRPGDKVVYIPIDSILPEILEARIFGGDSKIKLHKHRIQTIEIRGAISQGLVVSLESVSLPPDLEVGTDVKETLGIEKYEPPELGAPQVPGEPRARRFNNPNFHKYTNIENIKNYPNVFIDQETGKPKIVWMTEKLHGMNSRAGNLPFEAAGFLEKALRVFRIRSGFEFCYGSHNCEMQYKAPGANYGKTRESFNKDVGTDAFFQMVEKYELIKKLGKHELVYFEVYGGGVQKNYWYGLPLGEKRIAIIDVKINGVYLDTADAFKFCTQRGLPFVPILYHGPFSMEIANKVLEGPSVICADQKVKEGVVIKSDREQTCHMGRMVLKHINPEYLLLKGNTDFH